MKVQATDEDKMLAISKKFDDLEVKVINNGEEEIFDNGKKKFEVKKGTEASIKVC